MAVEIPSECHCLRWGAEYTLNENRRRGRMVVGATAPPWAASLRAGAESLTVTRHFTSESGTRPYSLRYVP